MTRITQLDGLRGLAIVLVIIWHYFVCQVVANSNPIVACLRIALSLTWSGVDLFFVLSGFLIAGILLDHRASENLFRVFYFRRICRIFPLYFLILLLFLCAAASPLVATPAYYWLFRQPLPILSYATFTQNFVMSTRGDFGPNWLGITWSLAVEEQFYLFLPLLIYLLSRRALVCVLGALILMAPLLRHELSGLGAFVLTWSRSDSLLSGALLAIFVRSEHFRSRTEIYLRSAKVALVVLVLGVAALTATEARIGGVLVHAWLAALFSVVVLIAYSGSGSLVARLLQSSVLVSLGKISFGIYMLHQAVSGLLHGYLGRGIPEIRTFQDAGVTVVALTATVVLAIASYRFVEGPILRFGRTTRFRPMRDDS